MIHVEEPVIACAVWPASGVPKYIASIILNSASVVSIKIQSIKRNDDPFGLPILSTIHEELTQNYYHHNCPTLIFSSDGTHFGCVIPVFQGFFCLKLKIDNDSSGKPSLIRSRIIDNFRFGRTEHRYHALFIDDADFWLTERSDGSLLFGKVDFDAVVQTAAMPWTTFDAIQLPDIMALNPTAKREATLRAFMCAKQISQQDLCVVENFVVGMSRLGDDEHLMFYLFDIDTGKHELCLQLEIPQEDNAYYCYVCRLIDPANLLLVVLDPAGSHVALNLNIETCLDRQMPVLFPESYWMRHGRLIQETHDRDTSEWRILSSDSDMSFVRFCDNFYELYQYDEKSNQYVFTKCIPAKLVNAENKLAIILALQYEIGYWFPEVPSEIAQFIPATCFYLTWLCKRQTLSSCYRILEVPKDIWNIIIRHLPLIDRIHLAVAVPLVGELICHDPRTTQFILMKISMHAELAGEENLAISKTWIDYGIQLQIPELMKFFPVHQGQ